MKKECKIIPYSDRQHIIDLVNSRTFMLMSQQNRVHPNFIPNNIENEDVYNHNLCFGMYEDGVLDCMYYIELWDELPVYSPMAFSRPKEGGREKYENKHDVNLTELRNFQLDHCEKVGLTTFYGVTNATNKWIPWHHNQYSRLKDYDIEIVEFIPAGQLSKYLLFRNHLVGRVFDVPLNVRKHTLKK